MWPPPLSGVHEASRLITTSQQSTKSASNGHLYQAATQVLFLLLTIDSQATPTLPGS